MLGPKGIRLPNSNATLSVSTFQMQVVFARLQIIDINDRGLFFLSPN